ncbi:MAG: hypothetical protein GX445_05435 [Elusimicrobia bacterium]|jgi:hypothetical protein|nr:hypothetical protein [Elusimicrobiota bacterium]
MITLSELGAPYEYVESEKIVSDVKELLSFDYSSNSVFIWELNKRDPIFELEGLGRNVWNEDASKYIKKLRSEWK